MDQAVQEPLRGNLSTWHYMARHRCLHLRRQAARTAASGSTTAAGSSCLQSYYVNRSDSLPHVAGEFIWTLARRLSGRAAAPIDWPHVSSSFGAVDLAGGSPKAAGQRAGGCSGLVAVQREPALGGEPTAAPGRRGGAHRREHAGAAARGRQQPIRTALQLRAQPGIDGERRLAGAALERGVDGLGGVEERTSPRHVATTVHTLEAIDRL